MSRHSGRGWIALVVALLAAMVVTNVVLMRVAAADPSVAYEPDAYRKAERWDDGQKARERSAALGWSAGIASRLGSRGPELEVTLTLRDASGSPLAAAGIEIEGFAIARSAARTTVTGVTDAAGVASFRVPEGRAGIWEWRVLADHGGETFVATLRETVPVAP